MARVQPTLVAAMHFPSRPTQLIRRPHQALGSTAVLPRELIRSKHEYIGRSGGPSNGSMRCQYGVPYAFGTYCLAVERVYDTILSTPLTINDNQPCYLRVM